MNSTKVTVDLASASLYAEPDSKIYRFKRRATYRDILRHLGSVLDLNPHASLLEVGTGSGFLIQILEEKYPDAILCGLEYDPRLVELTRLKLKRAKVVQGNAEAFDLGSKYDVIVCCQVIEHLFRPEGMVDCVSTHLKVGGIFVLTSPNLGSISARVMGSKWHGFRPDHVSLKTFEQWITFLDKQGFEKVYVGSTFFSGIPLLNRFPLGLFNWALLFIFGSIRWSRGESFVGVFRRK